MFTWNRLDFTEQALNCLLDSLYEDGPSRARLMLVQNVLVDGTREFVEKTVEAHPGLTLKLLQNRRPMVVAPNMVKAIQHCTAPLPAKRGSSMPGRAGDAAP